MALTERDFTAQVIQYAKLRGWVVAHFRPALTDKGWRTPVQGDAGFPDLVLARRGHIIFMELKSEKGKLSREQESWLDALEGPGVVVDVFKPSDWPEIEHLLT